MALVVNLSRRRAVEQLLGVVPRSIGYLQGGYKDSILQSKVQLFNTITQTGRIVYDTGYQRRYTPGLSGNLNGYFSINDSVNFNKFSYVQASASASFTTLQYPSTSASDFNVYNVGWLLCSTAVGYSGTASANNWSRVLFSNETPVNYGTLGNAQATSRQALSTSTTATFVNTDFTALSVLKFSNASVTTYGGDASLLNSGANVMAGMCRNDSAGYFVGFTPFNCKISYAGTTISAYSQETAFTYHFAESHSVTSATAGYMMAGYKDTTGRYGNTQHALCQKLTFSNSSITTLPDLVLPQSSGQMMEGF